MKDKEKLFLCDKVAALVPQRPEDREKTLEQATIEAMESVLNAMAHIHSSLAASAEILSKSLNEKEEDLREAYYKVALLRDRLGLTGKF